MRERTNKVSNIPLIGFYVNCSLAKLEVVGNKKFLYGKSTVGKKFIV